MDGEKTMETATTKTYTETEDRIFRAALKIFSRKGKDGARMQAIADEAGINKAMLHYYFRSKDRLYREVFRYVFHRAIGTFGHTMREGTTFEQVLRLCIDGYIDFVYTSPDLISLFLGELREGGPVFREMVQEIIRDVEDAPPRILMEWIVGAARAGEIRPVDPLQTTITLFSSCIFVFFAFPVIQVLGGRELDLEAFVEERKKHVFDVMFHGLKPREGSESDPQQAN